MNTSGVEYRGLKAKNGTYYFVLKAGEAVFGGEVESLEPELSLDKIVAIDILGEDKGTLAAFELQPSGRGRVAQFGNALKKHSKRTSVIGTILMYGALGATVLFPPAMVLQPIAVSIAYTGYAGVVLGKCLEHFASKVHYVKFTCKVESKGNLPSNYETVADVEFKGRMSEKQYLAVVEKFEELQRGDPLETAEDIRLALAIP